MAYNNKIRKFTGCIAMSALLLGLQTAAFGAGIGEKTFSIGPRATYSTPKDANEGTWSGGVQARMHLAPVLAVEGSIDYHRNNYGQFTTIKTYPVQASLLAYLMPGSSFSPFLIGGAGWYYTRVEGPFNYSNTTSRFGVHAGVGAEFMLNDFLSIDGTYRYIWLASVASKDANALDKTYKDSGSMITIALNFLF